MATHVRYEVTDRVATITIDRPEKRNAMTYGVLAEFHAAIARASSEDGVGAVIITGAGGAFCAGTDLSDLNDTPTDERGVRGRRERTDDDARPAFPWPIVACPRPVIAAVDGAAVGMGAEFATQCDVRIASTGARFGWVFVLRGLVADTGAGTFLLPRLIGPSAAMRLLFSGEIIDATTAHEHGFVSAVVAPEDLLASARTEAERYLSSSPFAVARTKELVYRGLMSSIDDHVARTATLLAECFRSEDHEEGVAAFLERRPANFTGR
jgi:enoyl-CoA hydratase/carnithine racemase